MLSVVPRVCEEVSTSFTLLENFHPSLPLDFFFFFPLKVPYSDFKMEFIFDTRI